MGKIEVKYLDTGGKVGIHTFDRDSKRINLPRKDYEYIDLSPLAKCDSIQTVFISCCHLRCLDITPVIHVPFEYLHHHGSTYTLFSRETVEKIQSPTINRIQLFDMPSYHYDESTIRSILPILMKYESDSWKIPFLGDCLVLAENIPGIGIVELSGNEIHELLHEMDRCQRRSYILKRFCDQIDSGGTTIDADIDKFMTCIPELTKRIKDIIELRKREMRNVNFQSIPETDEIDLRSLFLTAYGFEILSSLEIGVKCSNDEFKLVEKALSELDFSLDIMKDLQMNRTLLISKPLREYIWKLASNQNLRNNLMINNPNPAQIVNHLFTGTLW